MALPWTHAGVMLGGGSGSGSGSAFPLMPKKNHARVTMIPV